MRGNLALGPGIRFAQHEIAKRESRVGGIENEHPWSRGTGGVVHVRVNEVRPEPDLVSSMDQAEVFRELVDRRICHSRRVHCRASRPAAEGSLNLDSDDLRIVGWVPQPLYSEVTEVEQVRLDGFFIDRAQQSSAERTHHVRTDRICVTQYKGVSAADVITLAE